MKHSTTVRFCTDLFDTTHAHELDGNDTQNLTSNEWRKLRNSNKINYEIMNTTKIFVKPHFDIDLTMDNPTLDDAAKFLDEFVPFCNERGFEINDDVAQLSVVVELKPKSKFPLDPKLSMHIVLSNTYTTMQDLANWHKKHADELRQTFGKDKQGDTCVDSSIYRINSTKQYNNKWRTLFGKKAEKHDGFQLWKQGRHATECFNLSSFLISHTEPSDKRFTCAKKRDVKKVKTVAVTKSEGIAIVTPPTEELDDLFGAIKRERFNGGSLRPNLFVAGAIIFNELGDFNYFQKQFPRETKLEQCWRQYQPDHGNKATKAVLYHWLREDHYVKFVQLRAKYDDSELDHTHNGVAELFVRLFGDNFFLMKAEKKQHENLYHWTGVFWEATNSRDIMNMVATKVRDYALALAARQLELQIGNKDEEAVLVLQSRHKKLLNLAHLCGVYSHLNGITKLIMCKIRKTVALDTKPHLFVFNNAVFDLKKGERVTPNRKDYMTISCGYDYEPPDEARIKKLNDIYDTIFPEQDERDLYLIIQGTCLYGETLQKFILANGGGRNGKGLTTDLLLKMLGPYGYTASPVILTQKRKTGGNPEVANMHLARTVVYREPQDDDRIDGSTLKELTGGGKINARKLFSNDTETRLQATHIFECNTRPKISGRTDDAAMQERIVDIPFRNTFTQDENKIKNSTTHFEQNPEYVSTEFQEKHKLALFHILAKHTKKFLDAGKIIVKFIPQSIKDRTGVYLASCDEMKTWFTENFEHTKPEEKEFLSIKKDIYPHFTAEFFSDFSKEAKRKWTKSFFVQTVQRWFPVDFQPEYKPIVKGKQKKHNLVLRNWTKKNN